MGVEIELWHSYNRQCGGYRPHCYPMSEIDRNIAKGAIVRKKYKETRDYDEPCNNYEVNERKEYIHHKPPEVCCVFKHCFFQKIRGGNRD